MTVKKVEGYIKKRLCQRIQKKLLLGKCTFCSQSVHQNVLCPSTTPAELLTFECPRTECQTRADETWNVPVWSPRRRWLEMRHPPSTTCAVSTTARLTDQMFYLEDVVAGLQVGDVNPLTVDVVSVGIPAAHCDALGPEVCTFVPLLDTCQCSEQVLL